MTAFLKTTPLLLTLCPFAAAQDGEQMLVGGDILAGDGFGNAVALDDDLLVVGAPDHDGAGLDAGAAYVFRRAGTVWLEEQKLTDPELDVGDSFGVSVAVDGDRVVVGASLDEDADGEISGAVYVFEKVGLNWTRTARLEEQTLGSGAEYGFSVDLEGDRLVVGAHEASGGGAAYVYELDLGIWDRTLTLQSGDGGVTDDFGYSVALSDDWVLAGSPYHDNLGGNAGAAYVFDSMGILAARLEPSGPSPAGAEFGYSVALDGDLAVVGAGSENTDAGSDAGAAYVFRAVGDVWSEEARVEAPATESGVTSDLLGRSVDVSGERVVVGAQRADGDAGRAYLYVPAAGSWRIASVFTASDVNSSDRFGWAVGIDGDSVVAGIDGADDAGSNAGRVSHFDLDAGLLGGIVPLDLFQGGTQYLTVESGSAAAGDLYAVVGSLSGTTPGFAVHGVTIPVNPDDYFFLTVTAPNVAPLANSFGGLDANGRGFAQIDVPAGTDPSLVGQTVHHTAVTIQIAPIQVTAASRPLPTTFE